MRKRTNRILTYVIALVMVVTLMASPAYAASQRFKDVPTSRWYYQYVENLAEKSIVGGFGTSGQFRPDNKVERQHVAKMVTLAAGLNYKGKRANFPDVASNNAMSPFIAALQEKGIIKGYDDGTFRPTKTVTRAEVSVMIAKAFDLKAYGAASSMRDIKGHWAEGLIKILISNGIVKGYADGSFKPNNPVTRAELSKMLSVAMAVAGVQKAETDPRISTMYAAQVLIDSLPGDQDKATTEALYERLNALNGGDNVRFIEEKEPNDSRPKANIITLKNDGESYFKLFGTITSDIFDVDYFKFTLLHDSLVEILGYWASDEVYNQGFEDDLRICLYSARGDLVLDSDLAYSDDLDLEAFRYIQEHLTAGTYYIEVTTYGYEDTYVDKYYSINLGIFPD